MALIPAPYMLHHDPEIYPEPLRFKPERFLDNNPGTYTWIPFGGGRRRCLGAALRAAGDEDRDQRGDARFELAPARDRPERLAPQHHVQSRARCTVILRDRSAAVADPPPPEKLAAVA